MTDKIKHKLITYCIAAVWTINGLICKILNVVPRHEQIVSEILGNQYSRSITLLIGILEILIVVWILSGIKVRLNAITQIIIIAIMNTLEYILAPDFLYWGKLNLFFALLFILVIYYNEFYFNKMTTQ